MRKIPPAVIVDVGLNGGWLVNALLADALLADSLLGQLLLADALLADALLADSLLGHLLLGDGATRKEVKRRERSRMSAVGATEMAPLPTTGNVFVPVERRGNVGGKQMYNECND